MECNDQSRFDGDSGDIPLTNSSLIIKGGIGETNANFDSISNFHGMPWFLWVTDAMPGGGGGNTQAKRAGSRMQSLADCNSE